MSVISFPGQPGNTPDIASRQKSTGRDGGKLPPAKITVRALIGESDTARQATVVGRDAWALRQLITAGSKGCTPISEPAPRWSHYVWKLRRAGIDVATITETHGGPFSGYHARYVLRSRVTLLEGIRPEHGGSR